MTRDEFREAVFERDGRRCIICNVEGVDAHHLIERRLFPDGGYDVDNGVTLCADDHLLAESTELQAQFLRDLIGIERVVLPPHLYSDEIYDKWGNIILPNGRRLKGELFDDESVQKVLVPVLHLFDRWVKYPRTWHLPWSASVTDDNRVLPADVLDLWEEVVVTEKMDGENTSLYKDGLHARSVDFTSHPSRNWIRRFHAAFAHDIPEGMRICGENLSAAHSIPYKGLPSFFLVFSIWAGTRCLSWSETLEWCELFELRTVRVLYKGPFKGFSHEVLHLDEVRQEGYVIRPTAEFTLRDFPLLVGKYVRAQHVQTHGHWMRSPLVPNEQVK